MRAQATRMQSNVIVVGADHLALIILSNLDWAAQEEWGSNFLTPLQAIRKFFHTTMCTTTHPLPT